MYKEYISNESEKFDKTISRIVKEGLRLSVKALYRTYYEYALVKVKCPKSDKIYKQYISLYPSLIQ